MAAASLRCYCGTPSAVVVVAAAARRKKSSSCSRTLVVRASSSMDGCSGDASKVGRSNSVRVTSKRQHQVVRKVYYEDRINGILCYTDCNGELLCEGMDEGPRLTWQDMERLNKEKKAVKAEEDLVPRQRTTLPPVAVGWTGASCRLLLARERTEPGR